jgi:PilZ domain
MDQQRGLERRRFTRVQISCSAQISNAQGSWSGRLLDVSLQGVKIEVPEAWPGHIGESFAVRLFCEDGRVINMETRASHVDGRVIGFFCKGMDVSSMFLLRDIIEQAFSDQEQFLKELKEWW